MSIPMTCKPPVFAYQRKDVLFYVLFGANIDYISRLIEESVVNIAREYGCSTGGGLVDALQLMRPSPLDSLHKLQIKFFLLLNEDDAMRRSLSSIKSHVMVSLCPYKAERFYDCLCDELIPVWVRVGAVTDSEFVDSLRAAYLCS
jgi:hypothetical protein